MATDSALAADTARIAWPKLPERIPDVSRRWLILFQLLWIPVLLLAVVGPLAGTWYRFDRAGENSALMIGSRVGLVVSEDDLTRVRFPVGEAARSAGIRPGDDIIAINDVPIAKIVPISDRGLARPHDATETDYAMFSTIIQGGDSSDYSIRVRSPDGTLRDFRVRAGEQHIEQGARRVGLPPALLGVVDLLHLITYPLLLFAAWILHRRKPDDLVSSILSLAILLTIATEQPSAAFLTFVLRLPEWVHQLLYDVGNICLLAGILLFPFGRLRPRMVLVPLALLPILFLLEGELYRVAFVLFMAVAVTTLLARLRSTPSGDARQQIKWALLGFSGYAAFLAAALAADTVKLEVSSFGRQLLLEVFGGLSFGLAFLCLQLGLLVALLRFRLYDAEAVISRSASFAIITIFVGAIFAATSEAVKEIVLNTVGREAGSAPVIFAAAVATVLVSPAQERIQRWSERRFQRNLVTLREELPECMRELRESGSMQELLDETLSRIEVGVRTTSIAVLINGKVAAVRGMPVEAVETWLKDFDPSACRDAICSYTDPVFPVRVPLLTKAAGDDWIGWLLIGPRPDGSLLSRDEQRALAEVASSITRAIRVVLRREQRQHTLLDRIACQEQRIEALERRLSEKRPGTVRKRPIDSSRLD